MGRIKVNLTLDAEVAEAARALGLNMSRLAEKAIAENAALDPERADQMFEPFSSPGLFSRVKRLRSPG